METYILFLSNTGNRVTSGQSAMSGRWVTTGKQSESAEDMMAKQQILRTSRQRFCNTRTETHIDRIGRMGGDEVS